MEGFVVFFGRGPDKKHRKKKAAAAVLLCFLSCLFLSSFSFASDRLEEYSELVKSIDAEVEKPSEKRGSAKTGQDTGSGKTAVSDNKNKSTASKNSVEDEPASEEKRLMEFAELAGKSGEGYEDEPVMGEGHFKESGGEEERLKDFAKTARKSEEGYDSTGEDERLLEFADLARESGEGYGDAEEIRDDRLLEFAKVSGRTEKEYERKYGAVIEDHVISDPSKYNDGDRIVATENTRNFPAPSVVSGKYLNTKSRESTETAEQKTYRSESTRRFINGLFNGRNAEEELEKVDYGEDEEIEEIFYHDATSLGVFTLTAYDACIECCGKTDGITATMTRAEAGRTIAVDPSVIPYGTRVLINGHVYIAEDTGSDIKGKRIDIYMNTHEEALRFGRKTAEVFLVYRG